jgi:hypothetical protein
MNYWLMIQKGVLGLLTGLAAAAVFGAVQSISDYNPVVCSAEITTNCTSQFVSSLYYSIIPLVISGLTMVGNWLKHRDK